jgi:hypothetical protein
MKTKICTKCGIEKELSEFYKHSGRCKYGVSSQCKSCSIDAAKKTHLKNLSNPDYVLKCAKILKNGWLKRLYGITLNQYNELLESQNGACAICGKRETATGTYSNKIRSLAVDHNHVTGKIRGLLCYDCNTSLGKFKDNIKILQSAINYLTKE